MRNWTCNIPYWMWQLFNKHQYRKKANVHTVNTAQSTHTRWNVSYSLGSRLYDHDCLYCGVHTSTCFVKLMRAASTKRHCWPKRRLRDHWASMEDNNIHQKRLRIHMYMSHEYWSLVCANSIRAHITATLSVGFTLLRRSSVALWILTITCQI